MLIKFYFMPSTLSGTHVHTQRTGGYALVVSDLNYNLQGKRVPTVGRYE